MENITGRKYMHYKNKEAVRLLARSYYRANRGRNHILIGAAVCGIVVLGTVFSIAFGKVEAEYLKAARENGGLATTYLERGNREQYQKIKSLDYIREVGKEIDVGSAYAGEALCCEIRTLDRTAWEELTVPAYTGIRGEYPEKENEVMLSARALSALGITDPELGMEIPLTIEYRLFREEEGVFTLSGYFTDYLNPDTNEPLGYVSEEFAEKLGADWDHPNYLQILQKDGISGEAVEQRLYAEIDTRDGGQRFIGGNTFAYEAMEKFTGGWKIAVSCGILILISVFLLIQNVMHISMQREIRQYGLMQTIGVTRGQQRQILMRQMLRIAVIAGVAGGVISAILIQTVIARILGNLYLSLFGEARELNIFHPEILVVSICMVLAAIGIAAAWTMRRLAVLSPTEALNYIGEAGSAGKFTIRLGKLTIRLGKLRKDGRQKTGKAESRKAENREAENRKTEIRKEENEKAENKEQKTRKKTRAEREIFYMAWKNLLRYPRRFALTTLSLFLGITVALVTAVMGSGLDEANEIQARPDFALASSISANEMSETNVDWSLYNHDEFSPISTELVNSIENMNGVNKETIKCTEGAYFQVRDYGMALYPFGSSANLDENTYNEYKGTGIWASGVTVQLVDEDYLDSLEKFVKRHSLKIDMELLRGGEGVLMIHDHRLSPDAQKMGDETVGMPLSFRPLHSEEWVKERARQIDSMTLEELYEWDEEHEDEREAKEREAWESAVTMKVAGYLDTRLKDFPALDLEECYYGEDKLPIYMLVSPKGFEKLGEEKKVFSIQFDAEDGREPLVKQALQKLIKEENSAFLLSGNEKGVYMTAKSDLLDAARSSIQTNRIIMGALSAALIFMGLVNYFNIMATSVAAREQEFATLRSIGMTARQMNRMLLAEGTGYALIAAGLACTLGAGICRLAAGYIKSQVPYFVFRFPYLPLAGILAALTAICILLPLGVYKKYSRSI